MLVLSRKPGEGLVIAGRILVRVLAVEGRRVRLGVVAAADVRVDRDEIAELAGGQFIDLTDLLRREGEEDGRDP